MGNPYINDKSVKKLALSLAKQKRAKTFTRVGSTFLERINAAAATITAKELEKEEPVYHINKKAIKTLANRLVKERGIKRKINDSVIESINKKVEEFVMSEIHRHPSVGKTLQ